MCCPSQGRWRLCTGTFPAWESFAVLLPLRSPLCFAARAAGATRYCCFQSQRLNPAPFLAGGDDLKGFFQSKRFYDSIFPELIGMPARSPALQSRDDGFHPSRDPDRGLGAVQTPVDLGTVTVSAWGQGAQCRCPNRLSKIGDGTLRWP